MRLTQYTTHLGTYQYVPEAFQGGFFRDLDEDEKKRLTPSDGKENAKMTGDRMKRLMLTLPFMVRDLIAPEVVYSSIY